MSCNSEFVISLLLEIERGANQFVNVNAYLSFRLNETQFYSHEELDFVPPRREGRESKTFCQACTDGPWHHYSFVGSRQSLSSLSQPLRLKEAKEMPFEFLDVKHVAPILVLLGKQIG
jgi:hypothetical protein